MIISCLRVNDVHVIIILTIYIRADYHVILMCFFNLIMLFQSALLVPLNHLLVMNYVGLALATRPLRTEDQRNAVAMLVTIEHQKILSGPHAHVSVNYYIIMFNEMKNFCFDKKS